MKLIVCNTNDQPRSDRLGVGGALASAVALPALRDDPPMQHIQSGSAASATEQALAATPERRPFPLTAWYAAAYPSAARLTA